MRLTHRTLLFVLLSTTAKVVTADCDISNVPGGEDGPVILRLVVYLDVDNDLDLTILNLYQQDNDLVLEIEEDRDGMLVAASIEEDIQNLPSTQTNLQPRRYWSATTTTDNESQNKTDCLKLIRASLKSGPIDSP